MLKNLKTKLLNQNNYNLNINSNLIPTGCIISFSSYELPEGFLICDGSQLLIKDYPELYSIIGSIYGNDGTNFNLPDFRGCFLRGYKKGESFELGKFQDHALQSHTHTYTAPNTQYMPRGDDRTNCVTYTLSPETSTPNNCNVAEETRPKNYAVIYLIKY
ncbi:MAG TPA: phage tail protein [Candidatus Adamsella sp.]|nr:phage tail protein [Candidatus Adamsella sp.]